jgi:hypothetical protein
MLMLLSGIVGTRAGIEFSDKYWDRIKASCQFLANLMDCNGNVPSIGDATDSRAVLLDCEEGYPPYKSLLAVGASLFEDELMRSKVDGFPEAAYWISGQDGFNRFERIGSQVTQTSAIFRNGGYAILRTGETSSDELLLLFDSGHLGYLSIAAHGHADALSFTLSAFGKMFFIDPGTYLYFVDHNWRTYFKGTAAHNTIRIDRIDQAESRGDFVWHRHYSACLCQWNTNVLTDYVEGTHDGYRRLKDPVLCRRSITLDKPSGVITIFDTIESADFHVIEQFFHLSAECTVQRLTESLWQINNNGSVLEIEFDGSTTTDLFQGCTAPIIGWESIGYGRKRPSPTIRTTRECKGTCHLRTVIRTRSFGGAEERCSAFVQERLNSNRKCNPPEPSFLRTKS